MAFAVNENMTQATEVITLANEMTGGALGVVILMIVTIGTLITTSRFSSTDSFIASSLVATVVSILLKYLNLLNDWFVYISVLLFIVSIIISSLSNN